MLFVLKSGEKYFFQSKLLDGRVEKNVGWVERSETQQAGTAIYCKSLKGLEVGAAPYGDRVKQD